MNPGAELLDERQGHTVGTLFYGGSATPIEIDDRALAHLKVVISTKLRRSESFTLSWQHPEEQPRGRSTIWLQPSIPLRFVLDDPDPIQLNRAWIDQLAASANSSGGITLIAEHFDTPAEDHEDPAGAPAVRKVEVDELSIAHLTVAGTEVTVGGTAAQHPSAVEAHPTELTAQVRDTGRKRRA